MNPTDLPAFQGLSRAVAERVMGWTFDSDKDGSFLYGGNGLHDAVCRMVDDSDWEFWSPSVRKEHAWEVVERMVSLGFCVTIEEGGYGEWMVIFNGYNEMSGRRASCTAKTFAEAACRAALLALPPKDQP